MDWKRWIGLPHEFGADPEDGVAADCLLMVWRILDDAGINHPPMESVSSGIELMVVPSM